jgi:hypothetical protein
MGLAVILGIVLIRPGAPAAAPAPTTAPLSGLYGPGINADNLNNSPIGGPQNQETAYRFRATQSSGLKSVRVYVIGPGNAGYGAGTGGTVRITVQTDDGTASHAPSGTILATTDVVHPVDGAGNLYAFATPPTLTAGQLYHIVFRNIDADPVANFVSVDGTFVYETLVTWQPALPNTDWANEVRVGAGNWSDDRGEHGTITPIMALTYANGVIGGMGYMEVWYDAAKTISGNRLARESFTVGGSSRKVATVAVRLRRISGASPLAVRLETSNGTLVEQGSIAAAAIPIAKWPGWATYTFTSSQTLVAGQGYRLVLSTAADTSYSIFVIRKGVDYGYRPTYFTDGSAQYSSGSGWVPFDPGGRRPLDEGDLQLYFK